MKSISAVFAITIAASVIAMSAVATPLAPEWFVRSNATGQTIDDPSTLRTFNATECNGYLPACIDYRGMNNPRKYFAKVNGAVYGSYHGSANEADAYALSDLRTGELHLSQHAASQNHFQTDAQATAEIADTLHFNFTNGGADFIPITVRLRVDGTFGGQLSPRFFFSMYDGTSNLLHGNFTWGRPCSATSQGCLESTGLIGSWSQLGPNNFVGTAQISRSAPNVFIDAQLNAEGGTDSAGYSFADFSHTAAIAFNLPQGVTFTSASGVFLTKAGGTTVPEPAGIALFGLGAAALLARRSRVRG